MNSEKYVSHGLLAGMDVEELKKRAVTPPYSEYWKRAKKRWREVAEWEASTGRVINIGSCAGGHITWLVREAGLEYLLEETPQALEYVGKQIDKLARFFLYHPEEWKNPVHPYWSEMQTCLAGDLCRGGLDKKRLDDLNRLVNEKFLSASFIGWGGHYRYLAGHNMTVTEYACAGICALVWGEEAGRKDWIEVVERAIDAAVLYCRYSLDRQGFGYEGTMYSGGPMDVVYMFAQLLYQRGMQNLFEIIPELSKYSGVIRNLLFPDQTGMIPIADGGTQHPESYAWLLLTAKHYNRPEDLGLWYEFRGPGRTVEPIINNNPPVYWPDVGETGPLRRDTWGHDLLPFLWWDAKAPLTPVAKSPDPVVIYSPGTELAFFRTSWGKDAVVLNVNGQGRSHCALDHAHNDGGHFTIFGHGEYLAIDTGYWNTREETHSVALIDGRGQFNRANDDQHWWQYAGHLSGFHRSKLLDYVMVDQRHPRNCVWADRHVLFVRMGGDDAYIILVDNINPDNKLHTYQWQLQAHPDSEIKITGDRTAVVEKTKARLDLTFLSPLPTDFPQCPHKLSLNSEWVYGSYVAPEGTQRSKHPVGGDKFAYTREEARALKSDLTYTNWYRPRLIAEQSGPNCQLVTIITPRRTGAAPFKVTESSNKRTLRADIVCGKFVDTIIGALDHSLIKFPEVNGYTELALIRRDKSSGATDYWTVDGNKLEVK